MMTTFDDGIQLTDKFWDCECLENYIHPCTEEKCPVCWAERDTQPDSHVKEVVALLGNDVDL